MALPMGFRPNPFFIKEAEASVMFEPILKAIADEMEDYAKTIAPDAPPIGEGYIASFETEVGIEDGRVTAKLVNTDEAAPFIEFGTVDTPTFAILHKTGEKFGRFKPE